MEEVEMVRGPPFRRRLADYEAEEEERLASLVTPPPRDNESPVAFPWPEDDRCFDFPELPPPTAVQPDSDNNQNFSPRDINIRQPSEEPTCCTASAEQLTGLRHLPTAPYQSRRPLFIDLTASSPAAGDARVIRRRPVTPLPPTAAHRRMPQAPGSSRRPEVIDLTVTSPAAGDSRIVRRRPAVIDLTRSPPVDGRRRPSQTPGSSHRSSVIDLTTPSPPASDVTRLVRPHAADIDYLNSSPPFDIARVAEWAINSSPLEIIDNSPPTSVTNPTGTVAAPNPPAEEEEEEDILNIIDGNTLWIIDSFPQRPQPSHSNRLLWETYNVDLDASSSMSGEAVAQPIVGRPGAAAGSALSSLPSISSSCESPQPLPCPSSPSSSTFSSSQAPSPSSSSSTSSQTLSLLPSSSSSSSQTPPSLTPSSSSFSEVAASAASSSDSSQSPPHTSFSTSTSSSQTAAAEDWSGESSASLP